MRTLTEIAAPSQPDLVVFSHLRWDFVFQRPQHIMTRQARHRRVFFVEEPIYCGESSTPRLDISDRKGGIKLVVPVLPSKFIRGEERVVNAELALLMTDLIRGEGIIYDNYTAWYYTPMALEFTRHLKPTTIVYDCMDQLAAFRGAHTKIGDLEEELLEKADVVFTGGHSLFEEKKSQHTNIHPIPSSIDAEHFGRARFEILEPSDQTSIPSPRLGFFGVVDERFDIDLLRSCAELRPDWHFVILGPVVKIDPLDLPTLPNIHYLGMKKYEELPDYIAHWDVATLLFARNESTRFISPTKTPEYLAAGKPVVSTSIRDVIHPYGAAGVVEIADTAPEFIRSAESLMEMGEKRVNWLEKVDTLLASTCWERTYEQMIKLEAECQKTYRTYAGEPLSADTDFPSVQNYAVRA